MTAGGVKLSEISFKSFSSKLHDKLPGSGGRQDEAEDDDSDVDSESEYTSSDVHADDESERMISMRRYARLFRPS